MTRLWVVASSVLRWRTMSTLDLEVSRAKKSSTRRFWRPSQKRYYFRGHDRLCLFSCMTKNPPFQIDIGAVYNYSCKHRLSPDFKEEQREVKCWFWIITVTTCSLFSILIFRTTTTCELVARKPKFVRDVGRSCPFASKFWKTRSKQRSASRNSFLVSNLEF